MSSQYCPECDEDLAAGHEDGCSAGEHEERVLSMMAREKARLAKENAPSLEDVIRQGQARFGKSSPYNPLSDTIKVAGCILFAGIAVGILIGIAI